MTRTWMKAAALILLALTASPLAAAEYLALRFPPAEQPAVYLKFYKTMLRVADSPAALDNAPRLEPLPEATQAYPAEPGGGRTVNYGYAKVPLSTRVAGFTELSLSPRLYRQLPGNASRGEKQRNAAIVVAVTFAKQDGSGVTWGYVTQGFASENISTSAGSPTIIDIQTPRDLKLTLEAKRDEKTKKIGLGVRLMQGRFVAQAARKGDAPAPVHLAVYDSTGALVHSQDGDLEKLGFT